MTMAHYRLVAAIVFGLLAGLVNFSILNKSSGRNQLSAEQFVQVSKNMELGEEFNPENLIPITVPQSIMSLGNGWPLATVRWADRAILVNRPASRKMMTGDIVFHRDVQSPKERLDLRPDEVAIHVPLSGVVFQPELISVGDYVGFVLADEQIRPNQMTVVNPDQQAQPSVAEGNTVQNQAPETIVPPELGEVLGPFRLVAIGSHADPAARDQQRSANVIAVAGKIDPKRRLDRASQQLLALTGKFANKLRVVLYRPTDPKSSIR